MRLSVAYVIAESQMAGPLRAAVARLNEDGRLPFRLELDGIVAGEAGQPLSADRLRDLLGRADMFIGSMLNTDKEVRALDAVLKEVRPPVTAIFTSQPELMIHNLIGPLDARRLAASKEACRRIAQRLQEAGTPVPPILHVLLAAAPRLEPRLGFHGLGELWAYARAALYWLQGSVDNVEAMLLHLAAFHPRAGELGHGEASPTHNGPAPERNGSTAPSPHPGVPPVPWDIPAPRLFPEVALWHPDAPDLFTDLEGYVDWYQSHWAEKRSANNAPEAAGPVPGEPATVGLLLFRQMITSGSHDHYAAVIRALEARGLRVVAGFGGLDNRVLIHRFMEPVGIDALVNLTGFNLVGSMGHPQPHLAVEQLQRLDVPYIVALPLLFQTEEGWRADPIGLAPMQTALQVVLPELEGGIEPRVFGSRDATGRFQPVPEGVDRLAARIARWVRLRRLPASQRRVAIVLFSFPPDKGSIGSAAYLDVFESLWRLLKAMEAQGYDVEVPPDAAALQRAVLEGGEAAGIAGPLPFEGAAAARLDLDAYRHAVPYGDRLAGQWGPPPGDVDTYRGDIVIRGRSLGRVFVGIQPSFGYEGDPMRLLLSPDASPSHSFAAFYGWLERHWQADAVIHFGTHGAMEFMPGKQVGLTPACYPDLLLGDVPHLYLYAVNNPAEATIAKRRGYAATVSYLTPPLGEAGLYRDLAELKAAVAAYRRGDSPVTRRSAAAVIGQLMARSGLDADLQARGIALPPWDEANDDAVAALADYLYELETELIPLGLHIAGQPLDAEARQRFLEVALRHAQPEHGIPSLDELAARARGGAPLSDTERGAVVSLLVQGDEKGAWRRVAGNGAVGTPPPPEWEKLAAFSRSFLERLDTKDEIQGLLRGLEGRYIPPSPGGEPGRRPDVLPTGRNIHALDPQGVPSKVAREAGREMAEALLARFVAEKGRYPETVAMVLWGTDNIKTEGEGIAQALYLMGVEVEDDSRGRATRLRLIPLSELKRPRIDVVMTVSGIFRDIFPSAMALLDEAARLAAAADEPPEMNFIRRHALQFAHGLQVDWQAAASRVFSNRPGEYGTGVNIAVEGSDWETTAELGHLFIERKGFTFGMNEQGEGRHHVLAACLGTAELTFQNIDSTEISLADVDHYFEYLGGVTAAVAAVAPERDDVPVYVADRRRGRGRVRSLKEALQVEARTRLLNPAWYEPMLRHGYQGVHEVATRLDNTVGWSATTDAVDPWTYAQATDTFILDEGMRRRLAAANPKAVYRMVERLLEAAHRGWWEPDERQRQGLYDAFRELENAVEWNSTA